MSAFSDSMAAVGVSLITEFGEACTFTRSISEEYNPLTSTVVITADTTFTGVCFPDDYKVGEIDGTTIERDDVKLLVAKITGNEPTIDDRVTFSSNTYRIIDIKKTSTNGDTVLFELQVRE